MIRLSWLSMLPLTVATEGHTLDLPLWSVIPFVVLLLSIAILPLTAPHFWEHNRNKLILSLILGVPVGAFVWHHAFAAQMPFDHHHPIFTALHEYVAFILLLFSLFVISGGVYVRGSFRGKPAVNTAFLGVGALLASFIGTTGASMLLIRPLLRANRGRRNLVHLVVFFIFIVSNTGGLLTPLGDPPLFLGFLKGVPFTWTFQLWKEWLLVQVVLLALFCLVDTCLSQKDEVRASAGAAPSGERFGIEGLINVLLLAGVVATIYGSGKYAWPMGVQEGAMLALALVSIVVTPKALRERNQFNFGPILEVAALFLGIFLTMIPALRILNQEGQSLGITQPWQFFWASGSLSSFLDNAPTYLAFAAVGAGTAGISVSGTHYLAELLATASGPAILAAISCGSVFMGANTYIGNGPNFMVKAIAESGGVRMPSFFGYMVWSIAILIPTFVLVTFLFFV